MKRKHGFFQEQAKYFMPARDLLCNKPHLQAHWIKNFVLVMKPEELHFFIDEVLIAFKKCRKEYRHSWMIYLKENEIFVNGLNQDSQDYEISRIRNFKSDHPFFLPPFSESGL